MRLAVSFSVLSVSVELHACVGVLFNCQLCEFIDSLWDLLQLGLLESLELDKYWKIWGKKLLSLEIWEIFLLVEATD